MLRVRIVLIWEQDSPHEQCNQYQASKASPKHPDTHEEILTLAHLYRPTPAAGAPLYTMFSEPKVHFLEHPA